VPHELVEEFNDYPVVPIGCAGIASPRGVQTTEISSHNTFEVWCYKTDYSMWLKNASTFVEKIESVVAVEVFEDMRCVNSVAAVTW
jgi:hypothetical protein